MLGLGPRGEGGWLPGSHWVGFSLGQGKTGESQGGREGGEWGNCPLPQGPNST